MKRSLLYLSLMFILAGSLQADISNSKKETVHKKVEIDVDQLNHHVETLQTRATDAGAHSRKVVDEKMSVAEKKFHEILQRLKHFWAAMVKQWQRFRGGIDSFQKSWREVGSFFNKGSKEKS